MKKTIKQNPYIFALAFQLESISQSYFFVIENDEILKQSFATFYQRAVALSSEGLFGDIVDQYIVTVCKTSANEGVCSPDCSLLGGSGDNARP